MRQRVLVIDDDEAITELMQTALEGEGFAVRTVNDPRRALDECRSFAPHVVLLDLRMPYLDGSEVLALLKGDPALAAVPVIAFTAADEAPAPEARATVKKPFDFGDFLDVLRRVLAPA